MLKFWFGWQAALFLGMAPWLYGLTQIESVELTGALTAVILVVSGMLTFWLIKDWKLRLKMDRSLVLAIMAFGIMHVAFYGFYGTMPESDGYVDIIRIRTGLETGVIDSHHNRPFYYAAVSGMALLTGADLYWLYSTVMVALGVNILVVVGLLCQELKIGGWKKALVLFSALAVPVVNLEIDFFRPQNMYLVFFPWWVYLLYKNKWWPALGLGLIGLGYHQFFIFLVGALVGLWAWQKLPRRLFVLAGIMLLGVVVWKMGWWDRVSQTDKWRWWFLDNYWTVPDNVQMGWPGVKGALMFYGYYYGPIFGLVVLFLHKKKTILENLLLIMILSFVVLGEILPRINLTYLPERFPLLADLALLLILPFAVKRLKGKTLGMTIWIVLIVVGMAASFLVAAQKGSLTSRSEKKAAEWMRDNLSQEIVVYTQESNNIMIGFFAQRDWKPLSVKPTGTGNEYVVYSTNKLTGLRRLRQYWCTRNYCDFDVENYSRDHKLIYEKEGVYVWRVKADLDTVGGIESE